LSFESIVWIWIAIAVITFFYLLFKPAPYGRHVTTGWGPVLKNTSAWIIMEIPVFIIVLAYLILRFQNIDLSTKILMALFLLHYFNRCFIYPFRLQSKKKNMPLTVALSAVFFNLVNGNVLGISFTSYYSVSYDSLAFVGGCLAFLSGMAINILSDETLLKLKRNSDSYIIPSGGLYNYISCPNYFGELLEWLGFAIAAGNLGAWSFFIWTFANLVPRALTNHKWYKSKFPNYPTQRKAVIPLIL
jgi:protein-S-isoprenylcysteine O-methyltransferase Ste14